MNFWGATKAEIDAYAAAHTNSTLENLLTKKG
jgi:hypothetical protein